MASFPLKLDLVSQFSNWVCAGLSSAASAALLCLEAATASSPLPGISRVPRGGDPQPDFLLLESAGLLHQQPQPPPWRQASLQQPAWAIWPGVQPTLAVPCVASFSFSAIIAAASLFSSGSAAGPSSVTWAPRVTLPVALAAIAAVAVTASNNLEKLTQLFEEHKAKYGLPQDKYLMIT